MAEIDPITNMGRGDMYDTSHDFGTYGLYGPSLAEQWADKGITYEITDPRPTRQHTTGELKKMGVVGVHFIVNQSSAEE